MILVRKALARESKLISHFQVEMARETEGLELDLSVVEKGVSAVFSDPGKGCYYVAELDGKTAGSLLTTFEWSDWRNCNMVWIQSVYVMPLHRGKGVFSSLYGHLRQLVEGDTGLGGIRLYVDSKNEDAFNVYSRLGMKKSNYRMFEWSPGW